jgi:hypothetical protein
VRLIYRIFKKIKVLKQKNGDMTYQKNNFKKFCLFLMLSFLSACTWPNVPDVRLSRVSLTNPLGIGEEKYPINRWSFKRKLANNERYIELQKEAVKEQEDQALTLDPTYLSLQYQDEEIYTNLCPNNILVNQKSANSLFIRRGDRQCNGLFDFITSIFDVEIEPLDDEYANFNNFDDEFSDKVDNYNHHKKNKINNFEQDFISDYGHTPLSDEDIRALEKEMHHEHHHAHKHKPVETQKPKLEEKVAPAPKPAVKPLEKPAAKPTPKPAAPKVEEKAITPPVSTPTAPQAPKVAEPAPAHPSAPVITPTPAPAETLAPPAAIPTPKLEQPITPPAEPIAPKTEETLPNPVQPAPVAPPATKEEDKSKSKNEPIVKSSTKGPKVMVYEPSDDDEDDEDVPQNVASKIEISIKPNDNPQPEHAIDEREVSITETTQTPVSKKITSNKVDMNKKHNQTSLDVSADKEYQSDKTDFDIIIIE